MAELPTVVTLAGLQPQSPASLLAKLVAAVTAINPGYTADLPGSLIEDISSTDVAALALIDSFRVELVNSLTPFGANAFILNQLGQTYGVPIGTQTNTSVYLIFTGPAGFLIGAGFTVSDGTYQYIVQDGGIIGQSGATSPLFAVASIEGTWAVPANTVVNLVTSVPATISPAIMVTNPQAGIPGAADETESQYRSRVLQAGLATAQGIPTFLRTLLGNVTGVQQRLISILQNHGGWEIIVGGGDPYEVAFAIYSALFDINTLVGSVMSVTNITNANPGVVTTLLNYGLAAGTVINIAGVVGTTGVNNTPLTITVIDEKHFSIGIDTTSSGAYVSGGVVTPNPRNIVVNINDYPDTYAVPFVNPPQQSVTINLTWNTSSTNIVSPTAMAQAGTPALIDYINSIYVGQPINLFELQNAFQIATAAIIPTALLTRMIFAVEINGVSVPAESGTGIIPGDPESYFYTDSTMIIIVQS